METRLADKFKHLKTKRSPKTNDRGKVLYYLYIQMMHRNYAWLIKDNFYTVTLMNSAFRNEFVISALQFREWIAQGHELGVWTILEKETGYTKLEFPLLKALLENYDEQKRDSDSK